MREQKYFLFLIKYVFINFYKKAIVLDNLDVVDLHAILCILQIVSLVFYSLFQEKCVFHLFVLLSAFLSLI